MAPFVLPSDDLDFSSYNPTAEKCLLLSPPSLSSHPDALTNALAGHDRNKTDLQMLDRLAGGLITLPNSTYNLIVILSDADGTRKESQQLLSRDVMSQVYEALVPGGKLKSQDKTFGTISGADKTEAILAGLILNDAGDGMMKQADAGGAKVVMLNIGKKKKTNGTDSETSVSLGDKPKAEASTSLNGVGFVDFGDDLDIPIITGEDDELIDEDDLLTEEDMLHGVVQPVECRPKAGKRRRACKDCTCGLKEKIEAEDAKKRADADSKLQTLRLGDDEMAEVDFTVQGKVGSCGNCALGDAFRCDGCPYIGLPAFKPGEEVRLLNNDIQL